ncbi:hypothetical protein ABTY96_44425 [Streptomyces sp. NPDC096057]|uniref:hypothetical protein n=1 Tax=Streptomyces sp. NPDC096057 TaxID=3155543 RepID=UPI00331F3CA4
MAHGIRFSGWETMWRVHGYCRRRQLPELVRHGSHDRSLILNTLPWLAHLSARISRVATHYKGIRNVLLPVQGLQIVHPRLEGLLGQLGSPGSESMFCGGHVRSRVA